MGSREYALIFTTIHSLILPTLLSLFGAHYYRRNAERTDGPQNTFERRDIRIDSRLSLLLKPMSSLIPCKFYGLVGSAPMAGS